MIFTDYELAEWPALALFVGPHQPTPLRPDQLVMRVNVSDPKTGTGMVASGYAYHTLVEAILFGLVAKYELPGHQRWLSLDDAIKTARINLDGRDVEPWLASFLRENADAATRQVQDHLLDERFLLCLGSEYHDLDLEEDETWAPRQERERKQDVIAKIYDTYVKRPERWGSDRVGDVITLHEDDSPVSTVERMMLLAEEHGWSPTGTEQRFVREARTNIKRPGGTGTDIGALRTLYRCLLPMLDWMNKNLAPEGYSFEYAYGYLELVKIDHRPPQPGLLIDADGFEDEASFNLELIDLARLLGRKSAIKWRRFLWRTDYATPSGEWEDFSLSGLRAAADAALDWLTFERVVADYIYDIDEAGLNLRPGFPKESL